MSEETAGERVAALLDHLDEIALRAKRARAGDTRTERQIVADFVRQSVDPVELRADLRDLLAENAENAELRQRAESATVLPDRWKALLAERDRWRERAEKAEAEAKQLCARLAELDMCSCNEPKLVCELRTEVDKAEGENKRLRADRDRAKLRAAKLRVVAASMLRTFGGRELPDYLQRGTAMVTREQLAAWWRTYDATAPWANAEPTAAAQHPADGAESDGAVRCELPCDDDCDAVCHDEHEARRDRLPHSHSRAAERETAENGTQRPAAALTGARAGMETSGVESGAVRGAEGMRPDQVPEELVRAGRTAWRQAFGLPVPDPDAMRTILAAFLVQLGLQEEWGAAYVSLDLGRTRYIGPYASPSLVREAAEGDDWPLLDRNGWDLVRRYVTGWEKR